MRRWIAINGTLFFVCCAAAVAALNIGPGHVTFRSLVDHSQTASTIIWSVRLPRIILALLVGAALGGAGTAYQALLRNPLADPYILGVSGGAALGSAVAVALRLPFGMAVLAAIALSLMSMIGIYRFAAGPGKVYTHALLLTGVVFNAFAFAGIMFLHTILPVERSQEILFLLMGNLSYAEGPALMVLAIAVPVGLSVLMRLSPAMNAITLGDETASSLGMNLRRFQAGVFFAGSLMVGVSVAVSGLIGFVGLFVPHMVRLLGGSDHRYGLPASALTGALFLLAADTAARSVFGGSAFQTELPVGIITALIGAPCFVFLLRRQIRE